jgi:RNA recognition motif-containing protein
MAKKLYVGNLPWSATPDSLKEEFSKAGTVIATSIISDKMTGKSRGFGFVEMEDADMENAISMFNGKDMGGRTLTVNEARPMTPRTDGPRRSF